MKKQTKPSKKKKNSFEIQLIIWFRAMSQSMDSASRLLLVEQGITLPQLLALSTLLAQRKLAAGELSDALKMSASTLAELLVRLEEKGWIVRSAAKSDRRIQLISLSRKGKAIALRANGLLRKQVDGWLAGLNARERQSLSKLLQKAAAAMDASQ